MPDTRRFTDEWQEWMPPYVPRLVLSDGDMNGANKCCDCCPVLSCDVCGPCRAHDLTVQDGVLN